MASLNTLRTRGGVIVSIVIGIALLSFIISDSSIRNFMGGGKNSHDPKVGVIAGKDIRYSDFYSQRKRMEDIVKLMRGTTGSSSAEVEQLNNMVWEYFLFRNAFEPGFGNLGIDVSEAEAVDMTSGVYLSPVVTSTFVDPQTGMFNPTMLKEFIDNMSGENYVNNYLIWTYLKDQMNNQRVMSKFMDLVSRGMFVTNIEVEAVLAFESSTRDAQVVAQSYSSVADSLVKVSDAEIKKYYNNHKRSFRQTASRDIEYVVFDILPSEKDLEAGSKRAAELAEGLANADNPLQFALFNSPDERTPARFIRESQLDSDIAAVVLNDPRAVFGPVLRDNTYTIARLGEARMLPDSVGVSHIFLPSNEKKLADSLLNLINRGGDFASIAREYSRDTNTSLNGGDMGIFDPGAIMAEMPDFAEAVLKTPKGGTALVEAPYGTHIIKITSRTQPVKKVKVATIKYTVRASSATQSAIAGEAHSFYLKAFGSHDDFSRAVTESALPKRRAHIGAGERNVSGLDGSNELVRWAFTNKVGSISEPISIGLDSYVVAALTEAREDGIAPLAQVSASIREILARDKKTEIIASRMTGSSIGEIASNLGAEITEINDVGFSEFYLQGIGFEPRLTGAFFASDRVNTLSRPVQGNGGVYIFELSAVNHVEAPAETDLRIRLEAQSTAYILERATQAMYGVAGVRDYRMRYF